MKGYDASLLLAIACWWCCSFPQPSFTQQQVGVRGASTVVEEYSDTRGSISSPTFQSPGEMSWTISVQNAELLVVDVTIALKKVVDRRGVISEDSVIPENMKREWAYRYTGSKTFSIKEYIPYTRIRVIGITLNAYAPGAVRFTWTTNCTKGYEETLYRRCVSTTPCAAGYYLSDQDYSSCLACPPGTFSNVTGARFPLSCKRCPPGTSTPDSASTSCAPCPNGTFADPLASYGTYACTGCPKGSYQDASLGPASDASVCVACPAGKISTTLSSPQCTACAAGTYYDRLGGTACTLCSRGTYSNATAAVSSSTCQTCEIGKYSQLRGANTSDVCSSCPAGRYFVAADAACPVCPAGTFSSQERSLACTNCSAGTYADEAGSTACTACPAGTFSSLQGASSSATCTRCATGSVASAAGSTACSVCPAGTYSDEERSLCVACAPGTASQVVGAGNASVCAACVPGKFSGAQGTTQCAECALGTYVQTGGATACRTCPAGKKTASTGTSARIDCVMSYSPGSSSTFCKAGYYYSSASATCLGCPRGTFSSSAGATSQATACTPCPKSLFMPDSGATACIACIAGAFVPAGIDSGATYCLHDIEGNNNDRPLLVRNLSSSSSSSSCGSSSLHEAGYSVFNASHCAACPPGTYASSNGTSACTLCPPETYATGYANTKCTPCFMQTYYNPYEVNPAPIIVGTYAPNPGSQACSLMPPQLGVPDMKRGRPFPPRRVGTLPMDIVPNRYQLKLYPTQYLIDDLGFVVRDSQGNIVLATETTIVSIPSWRVNVSGMPYGNGEYYFVSVGDSDPDENKIPAAFDGTTAYWTSTTIYRAEREYVRVVVENGEAVPKQWWADGRWIELDVPQKIKMTRYRIVGRWPAPLAWTDGTIANHWYIFGSVDGVRWYLVWNTQMYDYLNTYFQWQVGTFPYFEIFYELSDTYYSNPLTRNYYTRFRLEMQRLDQRYPLAIDEWQIFGIGMCEPGMYWSDETSDCTPCAAGTYKSVEGGEYCTPCPEGTFASDAGATTCAACAMGTTTTTSYGDTTSAKTACIACEAGTYAMNGTAPYADDNNNPEPMATGLCVACPAGTFSTADTLRCIDCSPGTYAAHNGSKECTLCPAGTYAPNASSVACIPCGDPAEAAVTAPGSATCGLPSCPPGSYMVSQGGGGGGQSLVCEPCAAGTFYNATTKGCTPCPAGTFSAAQRALDWTSCQACPGGTYASMQGSTSCNKCAAGTQSVRNV